MVKKSKNGYEYTASQLFNFVSDSYLERTSRPIYALLFLLPFIVFYEIGTILINTDLLHHTQLRVVAFVWLQNFTAYLGIGKRMTWLGAPLVVIIVLIALQITSRKRWSFHFKDVLPTTIECIVLAVPLIVFSLLLNRSIAPQQPIGPEAGEQQQVQTYQSGQLLTSTAQQEDSRQNGLLQKSLWVQIVTGIGAGIYEELIFRLILICLLMLVFQDLFNLGHDKSVIVSVAVSALFFSLHHHIYPLNGQLESGEVFQWSAFIFRTFAGVYFASLFAVRGFAVTAGTHAFYNIIAALLSNNNVVG